VRLIDGDKLFARQNIIFGGRHAAAVESAFVLLCQRFEERAGEGLEEGGGWMQWRCRRLPMDGLPSAVGKRRLAGRLPELGRWIGFFSCTDWWPDLILL
jgi:hypothetical protein